MLYQLLKRKTKQHRTKAMEIIKVELPQNKTLLQYIVKNNNTMIQHEHTFCNVAYNKMQMTNLLAIKPSL